MAGANSFPLTDQNHFKYGFIEGHPTVYFSKIDLKSCTDSQSRRVGLDEAVIAAKKIYVLACNARPSALSSDDGFRVNLLVSGGIDSEVMLLAFLHAKIPFYATVASFKNNLNDFDIFNVIEFCRSHNIEIKIVELDVLHFFESGQYLQYGHKYRCQSPQLAVHLWLLDQVDGFPILSGNFIYPQHTIDGLFFVGLPGDLHGAYFRYFETTRRPGIPWFMLYTPELSQAFLETEIVQKQLAKKWGDQTDFSYLVKCEIYQQAGFNVKPRLDKYTGFEKIKQHYDEKHNGSYGQKFDEFFRRPLELINPKPTEFLQIVPLMSQRVATE